MIFAFYITYFNGGSNKEEVEYGFIHASNMCEAVGELNECYEEILDLRITSFEGADLGLVEMDALDSAQAWFQKMKQV